MFVILLYLFALYLFAHRHTRFQLSDIRFKWRQNRVQRLAREDLAAMDGP